MTELKTLKDLNQIVSDNTMTTDLFVGVKDLRAEAIKWIKEDYELVKNPESHKMLERWKDRFNISEDDLK